MENMKSLMNNIIRLFAESEILTYLMLISLLTKIYALLRE